MVTMKIVPDGQFKRYELFDGGVFGGSALFDEDSASIISISSESNIFWEGLFRAAVFCLLERGEKTVLLPQDIAEKAKKLGIIKMSADEEISEDDIISCPCHRG